LKNSRGAGLFDITVEEKGGRTTIFWTKKESWQYRFHLHLGLLEKRKMKVVMNQHFTRFRIEMFTFFVFIFTMILFGER